MTTLEAAADYGQFTQAEATAFLEEYGLTWEEAYADLGDSVLDVYKLAQWVGY